MAAVITSVEKVGAIAWRYNFTGTSPYKIVLRGKIRVEGWTQDWYIHEELRATDDAPPLEIIDSTQDLEDVASILWPGNGMLQWRGLGSSRISFYKVQKWDGVDTWNDVAPIVVEDNRGYFKYAVGQLDDVVEAQSFRVMGLDSRFNEGQVIDSNLYGRKYPEMPSVAVTYNETTKKFTIAEA